MNTEIDNFLTGSFDSANRIGQKNHTLNKANAKTALLDSVSKVMYAEAAKAKNDGKSSFKFRMFDAIKEEKAEVPTGKEYRKGSKVTVRGVIA